MFDFLPRLKRVLGCQQIQRPAGITFTIFIPETPASSLRHALDGGHVLEGGKILSAHSGNKVEMPKKIDILQLIEIIVAT
jgi:hypothetical protein